MTRKYTRRQQLPTARSEEIVSDSAADSGATETILLAAEPPSDSKVPAESETILPDAPQVRTGWKVLKEQMVIIHGGTTYVAIGKIVRDPVIAVKMINQGVEMEEIYE